MYFNFFKDTYSDDVVSKLLSLTWRDVLRSKKWQKSAKLSRNYYPSRGGMYPEKVIFGDDAIMCLEITIPHVEGCIKKKEYDYGTS